MLKSFIILISIFVNLLVYNRLYFICFKENIIFTKYLKFFLYFTTLETILIFYFDVFDISNLKSNNIQSYIISYFLMFLVIFFNICTKSYASPTFIIYNFIKKQKKKHSDIVDYFKKKKKLLK